MIKKMLKLSILIVAMWSGLFVGLAAEQYPQGTHVIAFDLHGVLFQRNQSLSSSLWDLALNAPNKLAIVGTFFNPFFWATVYPMANGSYSCEMVLDELASKGYTAVEKNYDDLLHVCNDYSPIKENVELVKQLQQSGVDLVLASNIGKKSYDYEAQNPELGPILRSFGFVHFAHEDQHGSKPSEEYFVVLRKAINAHFGIDNNTKILFVDDNYKNIQSANRANEKYALNIESVHYKNPAQLKNDVLSYVSNDSIGTKQEVDNIINQEQKPVIIDFFATWCGPCKELGPIFEQLKKEYGNIEFKKVDVDRDKNLASKYKIQSMPTIIFEQNGSVVYRQEGLVSKQELKNLIKRVFKK